MITEIEMANYVTYLNFISEKLKKFFESQKPYICCKEGCGLCCKGAQFPYSKIEAQYLLSGVLKLDEDLQNKLAEKIYKILDDMHSAPKGEKFRYDCPFLIDNRCCVYEYRGLVCRTFGLMTKGLNDKVLVPACCFDNHLNYANVMDPETKTISTELYSKLNIDVEPVAFNVSYEFLTDKDFERGFNFKFGEIKPLIEWFDETNQ